MEMFTQKQSSTGLDLKAVQALEWARSKLTKQKQEIKFKAIQFFSQWFQQKTTKNLDRTYDYKNSWSSRSFQDFQMKLEPRF